MKLDAVQEKVLRELIDNGGSCGYDREKFLQKLKSLGIRRPMPAIRSLCQKELMRFDPGKPHHKHRRNGVYKPLPKAWQIMGRR